MIDIRCDWSDDLGEECPADAAYYVEWDEAERQQLGHFGGIYCSRHTAAMRAGQSPFQEYGWPVTIVLIRTIDAQLALAEQARRG